MRRNLNIPQPKCAATCRNLNVMQPPINSRTLPQLGATWRNWPEIQGRLLVIDYDDDDFSDGFFEGEDGESSKEGDAVASEGGQSGRKKVCHSTLSLPSSVPSKRPHK